VKQKTCPQQEKPDAKRGTRKKPKEEKNRLFLRAAVGEYLTVVCKKKKRKNKGLDYCWLKRPVTGGKTQRGTGGGEKAGF